jgi:putative sigma-54 modulation protein
MDIVIRTAGLELTKSLEAAIEEKIGRIEHYGPTIVRARVFVHKDSAHASTRQYSVRVVAEIRGKDVTAEECGPDVLSALDIVAEKMERRLRKYKTGRLARRGKLNDRHKD